MSSTANQPRGRHIRQAQFAAIGDEGQARITASEVAVVGLGALGSVAAELLTRAGVGRIRLIDRDIVEWSNLQRQSLYEEADARDGIAKVEAAQRHLHRIDSAIELKPFVVDVDASNIHRVIGQPDLIIDACDNFSLRLLINDYALQHRLPWVHGGCVGASGQVGFFGSQTHDACFRCLVPNVPDPATVQTCDTAGVIGSATHWIASVQVTEALKFLSGNRDQTLSFIWSVDLWSNQSRRVTIDPGLRRACLACTGGRRDFLNAETSAIAPATSLCGRDAVQIGSSGQSLDLNRIADRWRPLGQVQSTRFFTRLTLNADEGGDAIALTLFRDGRAVIAGVRDAAHARGIYDRFVGS